MLQTLHTNAEQVHVVIIQSVSVPAILLVMCISMQVQCKPSLFFVSKGCITVSKDFDHSKSPRGKMPRSEGNHGQTSEHKQ